jgi:uncharacterized protein (DUF1778 family)
MCVKYDVAMSNTSPARWACRRHATRAAEDVLADRRVFMVSSEVWDRFTAALDRPAADVPGLEELMNTPTVLDEA